MVKAPLTQMAVTVFEYNREKPARGLCVVRQAEVPPVLAGHVLVNVLWRPINPSDIMCLQGIYQGFRPTKLPAVPGLEGMGVIAAVGEGVSGWKEGTRVTAAPWTYAEQGYGTWQEYTQVRAEHLVAVPAEVGDHQAAQFLVNPMTAYGFLEDLQVPADEWLLHNGASSVLGRELLCMARRRGTKLINVVRRHEAVDELKALGADEVICSTDEPVAQKGGALYLYSLMGGEVVEVPGSDVLFRAVVLHGWWLNVWLASLSPQQLRAALQPLYTVGTRTQAVMGMLADGTVRPPPPRKVYHLDEAGAAVEDAQQKSAGGMGKVMLSS
ncbi:hypothetical protein WJX81_006454 [Elliptochloris bilobata]|uniref:Enoyl reductase (ER) domain-containing protein n=1 Tax=Elliptochloris bilobata TaxID=381761 RepID=A0AAW1QX60_9CHLO